jgi:primosomal protein N' (replication factor Y)
VIVQTYNPEHYAIQAAARHDYSGFARQELAFRQAHSYPPYCRLAQLEFRDRRAERARSVAQELAQRLRAALLARGLPPTDLIGPAPAFFAKRRGFYRWHIILRAADPAELLRGVELPADCRVDIDPLNLL